MVIKEFYRTREDGVNLYRTYSDAGFTLIRNDGVEYGEAIDVETSLYTYTESENRVEIDEEVEEI
jgi:hypothetical protein